MLGIATCCIHWRSSESFGMTVYLRNAEIDAIFFELPTNDLLFKREDIQAMLNVPSAQNQCSIRCDSSSDM